jgi:peptide/nickel transport system substrate-binding protein
MRTSRRLLIPALLLLALGGAIAWWAMGEGAPAGHPTAPTPPDRLVGALRSEPRTYNRLVALDRASLVVSLLLHARLVRLNHVTQEIEPSLAESWTAASDGRTFTLALRRDVAFSDGTPFTSADVVFTFDALYDEKTASPLASSLLFGGKPIAVRAEGPHNVVITFPEPHGPGLRSLNSVPILPAHRLQAALTAGTLREQWSVTTNPGDLVGLGAFVLKSHVPGERLEFARNPHGLAARTGAGVPRVAALTLRIIPAQNAELLALEAGEVDLLHAEVRADDLAAVRKMAQAGRLRLFELGVGVDADSLWFNLAPARASMKRPWHDARFRRAISHAVDRRAFVDTVYLGAGVPLFGPVTPGNRLWYVKDLPTDAHDLGRARNLLAEIGLTDRDGDGTLENRDGSPLRIELLTQKGHGARERAAAVLAADLKAVGIPVDVVTLEAGALGARLTKGEYDATYFGPSTSDTDPSSNLDYWLSSGNFHLWHPRQKSPATPWEKQVDAWMREITSTSDAAARQARFADVQRLFAAEIPAIYFAAPTINVVTSPRVAGIEPGLLFPQVLWRADTLAAR